MAIDRFLDDLASAYKGSLGTNDHLTLYLLGIFREIGVIRTDGGPGSGNWGHEGRPGKIGGSAEGGGVHNREGSKAQGFTSFSKKSAAAAKPHSYTIADRNLVKQMKGSLIKVNGRIYSVAGDTLYDIKAQTFRHDWPTMDDTVQVFLHHGENKNYSKVKETTRQHFESIAKSSFNAQNGQEADDKFREQSGKVWRTLSHAQKKDLFGYTDFDYSAINSALRSNGGSSPLDDEKTASQIRNITRAIDKSELQQDTTLYRGVAKGTFESFMGLPSGSLQADTVDQLVGRCRTDHGFLSCGSSKENGMPHSNVQLEILCPKGTKGLYAEPFSAFGEGDGEKWDGRSKQNSISLEGETILQRGTSLVILSAAYDGKKYRIKCAVRGQSHN